MSRVQNLRQRGNLNLPIVTISSVNLIAVRYTALFLLKIAGFQFSHSTLPSPCITFLDSGSPNTIIYLHGELSSILSS